MDRKKRRTLNQVPYGMPPPTVRGYCSRRHRDNCAEHCDDWSASAVSTTSPVTSWSTVAVVTTRRRCRLAAGRPGEVAAVVVAASCGGGMETMV